LILPLALLSGGLATRLGRLTRDIPKAMLPVAGLPFIDHQLRLLKRNNFSRVVICVGHFGEQIQEYVGNGARFGLKVDYSVDGPDLLGTGGALKKALPLLGSRFLVMYGDSYLDIDYSAVIQEFENCGQPALMVVHQNRNLYEASNVVFHEGMVTAYDKRIKIPEMYYIDYGLSGLSESVLSGWPGDIFDLSEVYSELARCGKLSGFEIKKRFYEIGSTAGLAEVKQFLCKRLF